MIGINGRNGGHGRNGARDTLNVGLVGLGYWGPNLLRVLAEMPAVRVKWICDLDEQLLRGFEHRYPATARTTNVDLVFEDPEVDAIFIATPVFTHFDLASRSLEAGKHTFVEKPLAPSSELASELVGGRASASECSCAATRSSTARPVRVVKDLLRGTSWARSSSSPRAA